MTIRSESRNRPSSPIALGRSSGSRSKSSSATTEDFGTEDEVLVKPLVEEALRDVRRFLGSRHLPSVLVSGRDLLSDTRPERSSQPQRDLQKGVLQLADPIPSLLVPLGLDELAKGVHILPEPDQDDAADGEAHPQVLRRDRLQHDVAAAAFQGLARVAKQCALPDASLPRDPYDVVELKLAGELPAADRLDVAQDLVDVLLTLGEGLSGLSLVSFV